MAIFEEDELAGRRVRKQQTSSEKKRGKQKASHGTAVEEVGMRTRGQQVQGSQKSVEDGSSTTEQVGTPGDSASSNAALDSARPKRARQRAQSDDDAADGAEEARQGESRHFDTGEEETGTATRV